MCKNYARVLGTHQKTQAKSLGTCKNLHILHSRHSRYVQKPKLLSVCKNRAKVKGLCKKKQKQNLGVWRELCSQSVSDYLLSPVKGGFPPPSGILGG